jgi:hypothetical protein
MWFGKAYSTKLHYQILRIATTDQARTQNIKTQMTTKKSLATKYHTNTFGYCTISFVATTHHQYWRHA